MRLGARALLIYRRQRQDMPAFAGEVEMALEEGVELLELQSPVKIVLDNGDYLVTLQQMQVTGEDSAGRARVAPTPGPACLTSLRVSANSPR